MQTKASLIAIVGPTAVGKSEVAQYIAEKTSGEIVSIDAFQIYRGMEIGTAKVPLAKRRVKHYLLDIASPLEEYSVARFQREARSTIDSLFEKDTLPVLVGGSGLYLDAVIDEMDFPKGEIKSPTRQKYEDMLRRSVEANTESTAENAREKKEIKIAEDAKEAREKAAEELHQLLFEKDPEAANLIDPHNVKRTIRALEMIEEGRSYSAQHAGLKTRKPHYDTAIYALTLPRKELYEKINARVDAMFAEGFLDEVKRLIEEGLKDSLTAQQAIGYKEALAFFDGYCSLEEAKDEMKKRSRHYAKRQLSWIKRDGRATHLDVSNQTPEEIAEKILSEFLI